MVVNSRVTTVVGYCHNTIHCDNACSTWYTDLTQKLNRKLQFMQNKYAKSQCYDFQIKFLVRLSMSIPSFKLIENVLQLPG